MALCTTEPEKCDTDTGNEVGGSALGGVGEPLRTRRYVTNMTPRYRGMKPRSGGVSRSTAS